MRTTIATTASGAPANAASSQSEDKPSTALALVTQSTGAAAIVPTTFERVKLSSVSPAAARTNALVAPAKELAIKLMVDAAEERIGFQEGLGLDPFEHSVKWTVVSLSKEDWLAACRASDLPDATKKFFDTNDFRTAVARGAEALLEEHLRSTSFTTAGHHIDGFDKASGAYTSICIHLARRPPASPVLAGGNAPRPWWKFWA